MLIFDVGSLANVVVGTPDRSTITIVDDDTAPPDATEYTVSFDTASLVVDEGVGTVAVMVSITPTPFIADGDIIVPITTSISVSNAASPDDYTLPTTSSVTFSATTTEASFVVMITDDDLSEMNETITLIFDSGDLPDNVVVGSSDRSTITITDNELPPLAGDTEYTVSFATASQTVAEDVGTVAVRVSISPTPFTADGDIIVPIIVDSSVVGIVHTSPDDYILPTPSNVIFDATTTEVSFEVIIIDDEVLEGNEIMVLIFDVSSLANVTAGPPDLIQIIITDNPDFRLLVDPEHARPLEDSIVVSTYPNPVVDVLHISFADFRDYEASLVTLGGISVLRQTNPTVLDMSTFAPGVYLLSLSVDGHMIVRRVVKE